MAPRKNTQGAEDSLKGPSPEKAEAPIPAPGTSPSQQQPGGGDHGEAGSSAGTSGADQIGVPQSSADAQAFMPAEPERRMATATGAILHDLHLYLNGDALPVTAAEFEALSAVGGLVESSWDDLTPA